MVNYKALGSRIKDFRINKKLTQKELAEKVNITDRHISNIEAGRSKASIETVVAIVNVLGISLDNILLDSLDNVTINKVSDSKIIYNKEIKELVEDLSRDELKIIIEMIKYNKESIRKTVSMVNEKNSKNKII